MKGRLHCPHNKAYCVEYQTSLGTLKGIENSWDQVPAGGSCQWENQQHGRGHHCKIVLEGSSLKEGTCINLVLVHEDGTKAPDATLTKHGKRKSTMLIGVDPRDSRLGLSWTTVDQEGHRKWYPASSCRILVTAANTSTRCTKKGDDSNVTLSVPVGQPIVIPIRIEVLSAVKGAGDFSRYCVSCTAKCGSSKKMWKSPSILVEAKWLPAAPVREQNKRRFNRNVPGKQDKSESNKCAGGHAHGLLKQPLEAMANQPFEIIKAGSLFIRNAANSLHQLHTPRHAVLDYSELDQIVEELQQGIAQYQQQRALLRRGFVGKPKKGSKKSQQPQHQHPPAQAQFAPSRTKTSYASQFLHKNKHSLVQNWTAQEQQQLLSSPPRSKRIPGLASRPPVLDLNKCESLALSALKQEVRQHGALHGADAAGVPGFNPFDLLATAASKKHQIPFSASRSQKRQRT